MGSEVTALAAEAPNSFAFGPFVLVPDRQLLLKDGAPVRIGGRALDILTALIQRQGNVVSKRQLMAEVWPDMMVDEGNLKVNMAALRRILDEDPGQPRYIATVVGRGYRFIATIRPSGFQDFRSTSDTLARQANSASVSVTRIFGRAGAISSILRELESARLISIVGPGGTGKTTVALAVAREAVGSFDDGVRFVDLTPLHDHSLVPAAVAAAVGVDNPAALHDYLRHRKMLLVLDNCEHLINAVADCADQILTGARNVKLLATSREPLCIKGERVRRLSGLNVPPASSQIKADDALDFAAVQLFADRATRKCPSFRLTDANAPIVSEICRRMDGLALAIERVAMRVNTLEVGKMLDHINKRFHMLDGYHAGPERHRTLTAAIDWSYGLLSDSEQAVMRRLSVFTGAFSLELACAVGAGDGVDPGSVIEDVANLAAKSLLIATLRDGEMDYQLTNIARAFALEKLVASGEFESAQRRQAHHGGGGNE